MIHKKFGTANRQYVTQHSMTKKVETYVTGNECININYILIT